MILRRVQREVTEAAIQYLHSTYLDHLQTAQSIAPVRGRVLMSGTALGLYDIESASKQGCFLRLISVVEAYVDTVSGALFRENTPTTHELVRRLVENAELRASTTWQERIAAFQAYHLIRLGGLARWSELDAGIEVRNAIAHGLGQLTPRQRNGVTSGKLSQIGVSLRDGYVVITIESLRRCCEVCVEFIASLDNALPPVKVA